MADTKISAMTAATDVVSADVPIVQGGVNKKAASTLFGLGNVVGPATPTDGRVAAFDGTTGKLIKQGTQLVTDLVSGPAVAVDARVAAFSGTSGKLLAQGAQLVTDLVSGPASVTDAVVALFSGTTGKLLKAASATQGLLGLKSLSTGTYTPTAGTTHILAFAWGGGGGGGGVGATSGAGQAGNGGAGEFRMGLFDIRNAGVLTATVPAAANGGAAGANNGADGSDTTLVGATGPTTLIQAAKGLGGTSSTGATTGNNGGNNVGAGGILLSVANSTSFSTILTTGKIKFANSPPWWPVEYADAASNIGSQTASYPGVGAIGGGKTAGTGTFAGGNGGKGMLLVLEFALIS